MENGTCDRSCAIAACFVPEVRVGWSYALNFGCLVVLGDTCHPKFTNLARKVALSDADLARFAH
jgi:hypothetical protein